ncbi:uncharacterized protein BDZ99DRAFT_536616 [Mytilinidion resinicola]|uniref:Uncharacterized protein n=1 Tax=Mytilinidion resinicola TaxID=574789 RepID=A0A6A6YER0_9PEZI|nr:uncharacterized protein BDZ99DRAFT_536616 [Mytilinidion resinicola]KAF2807281.1 hypothetical protein BDZ99DRAFT_536616 [Mytilinidion resinicola]
MTWKTSRFSYKFTLSQRAPTAPQPPTSSKNPTTTSEPQLCTAKHTHAMGRPSQNIINVPRPPKEQRHFLRPRGPQVRPSGPPNVLLALATPPSSASQLRSTSIPQSTLVAGVKRRAEDDPDEDAEDDAEDDVEDDAEDYADTNIEESFFTTLKTSKRAKFEAPKGPYGAPTNLTTAFHVSNSTASSSSLSSLSSTPSSSRSSTLATASAQPQSQTSPTTITHDPDLELSDLLRARHQKNTRYRVHQIVIRRQLFLPDWYDRGRMEEELEKSRIRETRWLEEKKALDRQVHASRTWDSNPEEKRRVEDLKLQILVLVRRVFIERAFRYDVEIEMHRLKKRGPDMVVVNGKRRPIGTLTGDEWREIFNYRVDNSWNYGASVGLLRNELDDTELINMALERGEWEIKERLAYYESQGLRLQFEAEPFLAFAPQEGHNLRTHEPGLHLLSNATYRPYGKSLEEKDKRNVPILQAHIQMLYHRKCGLGTDMQFRQMQALNALFSGLRTMTREKVEALKGARPRREVLKRYIKMAGEDEADITNTRDQLVEDRREDPDVDALEERQLIRASANHALAHVKLLQLDLELILLGKKKGIDSAQHELTPKEAAELVSARLNLSNSEKQPMDRLKYERNQEGINQSSLAAEMKTVGGGARRR